MSMSYLLTDSVGQGAQITLDNVDDVIVAANATVVSTAQAAIVTGGWGNQVQVCGTVIGNTAGVQLGDGYDDHGTLRVFAGGVVSGNNYGVLSTGYDNRITNAGEISGDIRGLEMNFGGTGIVVNQGTISGIYGISMAAKAGAIGWSETTNYGHIIGKDFAFSGSAISDALINRGDIKGYVSLLEGNDVYDGRGGRVDGLIDGGAGNDTFRPGMGEEFIQGDTGIDTLDFRSGGGLRVSLVDDSGSGAAEGDTYLGIDAVLGSRHGNDWVIGNNIDNTLKGFGGNDRLLGGKGHDTLAGGDGSDTLTGGRGSDTFLIRSPEDGVDAITDFLNNADGNDRILIDTGYFLGGLAHTDAPVVLAASRFIARADNLAQDADDRFIFRTTDTTLWWDDDGKGGHAAVLIADLQAGAALTAADIFTL
jgi:Ca2+-binding RTX toxin-like protein